MSLTHQSGHDPKAVQSIFWMQPHAN